MRYVNKITTKMAAKGYFFSTIEKYKHFFVDRILKAHLIVLEHHIYFHQNAIKHLALIEG